MSLSEITRESVILAIQEFDNKGKKNFLDEYGYKDAIQYFLLHEGKYYPSKAIAGVAHKYVRPGSNPLSAYDFSGGKETVEKKLEKLGFTVEERDNSTVLILVENEVTFEGQYDYWEDLTGVSYQYPNIYKNKIGPGKRFVYYRGVRRSNNRIGQAEYFGTGRILEVWRDPSIPENAPKKDWKWNCSIDEYLPFPKIVPIKINGVYFENISNPLGWRTGVREISEDVYKRIMSHAGIQVPDGSQESDTYLGNLNQIPIKPISQITVLESKDPLDGLLQTKNINEKSIVEKVSSSHRRSKQSKQIGDRAEEIVFEWLKKKLSDVEVKNLRWVANEKITPGWDIQFCNEKGEIVGIEVKGTTAAVFPNFEMTDPELKAAKIKAENYWLVLVSNCTGQESKINVIKNVYSFIEGGELIAEPIQWRLRK